MTMTKSREDISMITETKILWSSTLEWSLAEQENPGLIAAFSKCYFTS